MYQISILSFILKVYICVKNLKPFIKKYLNQKNHFSEIDQHLHENPINKYAICLVFVLENIICELNSGKLRIMHIKKGFYLLLFLNFFASKMLHDCLNHIIMKSNYSYSFRSFFEKVIIIWVIGSLIYSHFMIHYQQFGIEKNYHNQKGINSVIGFRKMIPFIQKYYLSAGCINEVATQGRSYMNTNVAISNCFFIRSGVFSGKGGVVFVDGTAYKLNITNSMFFKCICNDRGGAICLYNSASSFLKMICANGCSCGSSFYGHFSYIRATQNNQVEFLSITACSNSVSGSDSFCLMLGTQRIDQINSSLNKAFTSSGFMVDLPSTFSSSFCTFSENSVSKSKCIDFNGNSGKVYYANIVHNNSPSQDGIVYISGNGAYEMLFCIFSMNNDTLFYVNTGSLEVSHSFISHFGTLSTLTSITTGNNNSFGFCYTYYLQFFSSHYCNTDIFYSISLPNVVTMLAIRKTIMHIYSFLFLVI